MAMYIILSRFSPEAFREPKDFRKLAEEVSSKKVSARACGGRIALQASGGLTLLIL